MKKRFYTALTLSLMALSSISAQGILRSKAKAHAHSVMGQSATAAQASSNSSSNSSSSNVPRMVSAKKVPVVITVTISDEATVQKNVPVGFSHSTGVEVDSEAKLVYDKNGNITEINYAGGTSEKISYTYNEQNKWTQKICSKVNGEGEKKISESDRTYDAQGRLLTADEWAYDSETQAKYPVSSRAYTYDKNVFLPTDDNKAYELKDLTYEKVGDKYLPVGLAYVWFEATQSYVMDVYNTNMQYETTVDGNTYVQAQREIDPESGHVLSTEYQKCEAQVDQPQGFNTLVYSHSVDGTHWTYDEKVQISSGYDFDFSQNDGKHRERAEYRYDEDSQKFVINSKTTYDWVNHPYLRLIKKTEYRYEDGELDEVSSDVYPVKGAAIDFGNSDTYYLAEDDSYVVNSYSNTDDYDYYTYYTAQGEEYRKLRVGESKNPGLANSYVEEYKDGLWVPVKNETLKMGSGDTRLTVKLNEKGYPVWSEAYMDGELDLRGEVEYSDNGYSEKDYTWSSESQRQVLESTTEGKVLADGSQEVIDTEYNEDGSIDYKYRNVYQADGIQYYYRWDTDANDWGSLSVSVPDVVTTAADGTTTTIARQWEDGKIVEVGKTVEYKNADGSKNRSEHFRKNGEVWTPAYRIVYTAYSIPELTFTSPANPLPGIIPDYVFSIVRVAPVESGYFEDYQYWDTETNTWVAKTEIKDSYSEREENGQKIISIVRDGFAYKYTVDSHNRLSAYEGYDGSVISMFVYDDEGRLTKVTCRARGNDVDTYKIIYGYIDVVDGIEKPAVAVSHLHIDGKTVSAAGCKSLRLYGMDGKLVGESQQGIVSAPSAGVYVVVADGIKTKVVLR